MLDDVLQAVVAAGTAAGADAELTHRQGDIVGDDHHVVRRDLIEPGRLADGFAGEVHVGLGLHHQHLFPVHHPLRRPRPEAQLIEAEALPPGQPVHRQKAHVVAGTLVFGAGVAQPHQQPADAAALALKDHRSTSFAV